MAMSVEEFESHARVRSRCWIFQYSKKLHVQRDVSLTEHPWLAWGCGRIRLCRRQLPEILGLRLGSDRCGADNDGRIDEQCGTNQQSLHCIFLKTIIPLWKKGSVMAFLHGAASEAVERSAGWGCYGYPVPSAAGVLILFSCAWPLVFFVEWTV